MIQNNRSDPILLQRIQHIIRKSSRWGWYGASGCILIIVLLIIAEIGVRSLTGSSTFITEEYCGYLLACFAFLGMAETLRTDGHIRVTIIISRLGEKMRALFEVFGNTLGCGIFFYMSVYLGLMLYSSWNMGVRSMHVSQTPLFIPQIVPVVGSVIMALQFFIQLLDSIFQLFERKK